jgi:hypothetical protein
MLILRNPLAKPQNNPNRKRTKRKLFKINLSQFKTTSHKNNDIKIAKPNIKSKRKHGLTHWLNQHLSFLLNRKHIEFPNELSKTNIRCLQCCLITSNLDSTVHGVNKNIEWDNKSYTWFNMLVLPLFDQVANTSNQRLIIVFQNHTIQI